MTKSGNWVIVRDTYRWGSAILPVRWPDGGHWVDQCRLADRMLILRSDFEGDTSDSKRYWSSSSSFDIVDGKVQRLEAHIATARSLVYHGFKQGDTIPRTKLIELPMIYFGVFPESANTRLPVFFQWPRADAPSLRVDKDAIVILDMEAIAALASKDETAVRQWGMAYDARTRDSRRRAWAKKREREANGGGTDKTELLPPNPGLTVRRLGKLRNIFYDGDGIDSGHIGLDGKFNVTLVFNKVEDGQ